MTTQPTAFVAYVRVSTDKQGRSGLGLDAQKAAIATFLRERPGSVLLSPEYVEVESGRNSARPKLAEAMERCRRTGATLLIAKLDRLARDAHFLLGLQKAGVDFVAADMPSASRLVVGILAMVAEEEARAVSVRTKAALAAAKARGQVLGRPEGTVVPSTAESRQLGAAKSAEARSRKADRTAYGVLPRIAALQSEGLSLGKIAEALNAEGSQTPRGSVWTATAVRRVILRTAEAA